ncbi:MAG: TlpA family protein disulfide reductase [Methylococcaceae bacterium]|jgi:thiol-disulfide isomerase/thioredoxin|nr:TlpA family protein disulfide reductase [Methylococcaceae bacterium]MDD1643153.1 TlpA family protein disulfide reductase [Methylococcaceae bacterium]OYV15702.1 MAG: Redoxin domain-containing protein [Methylococcaceae bacterium NSM2-1]
MKPTGLIIIAAVLALGGGILARGFLSPVEQISPTTLPDFNLPDVSGNQHNISEWQGKIRVINFWATWCPPCLKEIPEFIALQEQYAAYGVQFIGIAIDDQDSVEEYLASAKINYPILIGGVSGIALAHQLGNGADAVPFTLVVNQQGQIIHQQPGEFTREKIMEVIKPLLK